MEINKQLFEDVLSGKLKGKFVLRNKQIIKSNTLKRSSEDNFPYKILIKYDNGTSDYGTYKSNGNFETINTSHFDIIDFIPDTNMKENELTIEIPNGKIVDWDESKKQNKIVLKDKQLTYEDICGKLFKNKDIFYIQADGCIESTPYFNIKSHIYDKTNATTEHQLECILAKNQLATVAKYLNDVWKPNNGDHVFYLTCCWDFENKPYVGEYCFGTGENLTIFKTQKDAAQAIEILGEETVKLALEPLGI